MQNNEGRIVDVYIPRKCYATNRIISAKDSASVQIDLAELNEAGIYVKNKQTIALSGFVRARARSDFVLTNFAIEKGLIQAP
ncbi:hypothetical protein PCE1_001402 [Barthelona sp. PCE]